MAGERARAYLVLWGAVVVVGVAVWLLVRVVS